MPGDDQFVAASKLYLTESRTGTAINPETQTVAQGMLYSAQHKRLKRHVGFYVEIGLEERHRNAQSKLGELFDQEGMTLPFGGEGRRVVVRRCPALKWPEPPPVPKPEEGGFTTVLISPYTFEPRPDSKALPWHPPHVAKLCAVATGRPLPISGWSLVTNQPKAARHAVDSGATYFWQTGKASSTDSAPKRPQLAPKPLQRAEGLGVVASARRLEMAGVNPSFTVPNPK